MYPGHFCLYWRCRSLLLLGLGGNKGQFRELRASLGVYKFRPNDWRVIRLPHIRRQISIPDLFCLGHAVAEVVKPIPEGLDFEVLVAHFLHRLEVMQSASRPERHDLTPNGIALVPRSTILLPYGALHVFIFVGDEIVDGLLGHFDGLDCLLLDSRDDAADVIGLG